MPRKPRQESIASIHHVINRGTSQQIIYETDEDRAYFMSRLNHIISQHEGHLFAWCLMGNHFHLLLQCPINVLSVVMHDLQTSYSGYFNRTYGRNGTLFGGRFKNEPINTDEYLMTVVRYIHENPLKAGLSDDLHYTWSSYDAYIGKRHNDDIDFVLKVFGGLQQFIDFHTQSHKGEACIDIENEKLRKYSDSEAIQIIQRISCREDIASIKSCDKETRDAIVLGLKQHGLGSRQIQRLTGISMGLITKIRCVQ
ncbi:MAG: transposase [Coriobacteriales bacterium]|nr:transposase [Coriobacteriales bacterium]